MKSPPGLNHHKIDRNAAFNSVVDLFIFSVYSLLSMQRVAVGRKPELFYSILQAEKWGEEEELSVRNPN